MSRDDEKLSPPNQSVRPKVVRTMILGAAETLFPGYFALTMATGVVSVACALLGMRQIAWALLVVNWIIYPSLWGLTLVRTVKFPRQFARDIYDHQRAPGVLYFFTPVTIRARKPSLAAGINGAWLIRAVATQSIVVLRGVVDTTTAPTEPIQFVALVMFMIGSML